MDKEDDRVFMFGSRGGAPSFLLDPVDDGEWYIAILSSFDAGNGLEGVFVVMGRTRPRKYEFPFWRSYATKDMKKNGKNVVLSARDLVEQWSLKGARKVAGFIYPSVGPNIALDIFKSYSEGEKEKEKEENELFPWSKVYSQEWSGIPLTLHTQHKKGGAEQDFQRWMQGRQIPRKKSEAFAASGLDWAIPPGETQLTQERAMQVVFGPWMSATTLVADHRIFMLYWMQIYIDTVERIAKDRNMPTPDIIKRGLAI